VKTAYAIDISTKTVLSYDSADQHSHDLKRMKRAMDSLVREGFGMSHIVADNG
jgi:hypothetical protein